MRGATSKENRRHEILSSNIDFSHEYAFKDIDKIKN